MASIGIGAGATLSLDYKTTHIKSEVNFTVLNLFLLQIT
jgi:hypothetical protein